MQQAGTVTTAARQASQRLHMRAIFYRKQASVAVTLTRSHTRPVSLAQSPLTRRTCGAPSASGINSNLSTIGQVEYN
eukprot:6191370-Pleurochrysis_carterae.AAC.1